MTLAQDYINQYYPLFQRNTVTKLDLANELLEGNLSLETFINLEELDCSNNNITKLTLGSSKLHCLDCSRNNLTDLDLTHVNSTELTYLRISNNKLTQRDLSIFSRFTNLEVLTIGSDTDKKFNNFVGSLKPLQTLRNLKNLDISNTNIDSGLEYLPDSLIGIYCYNDKKIASLDSFLGILTIHDALKVHNFQISKWRKANISDYIEIHEKVENQEKEIKEYQEILSIWSEEIKTRETKEVEVQTEEQKEQEKELEKLIKDTEQKLGKSLSEILKSLLKNNKELSTKIEILPK